MKKSKYERYDLDKVYFMNEYNKTVTYGNTNAGVSGVKEQLQGLELEKSRYFENVASIVNPERENEELKYRQYEKWAKIEKKYKYTEIFLIAVCVAEMLTFKYRPIGLRTSLFFDLFEVLLVFLTVFVVPIIFIITKIIKHGFGIRYKRYIELVSNKLNNLGNGFIRTSIDYYDAIDNLYLLSLDTTHRELVLLRRQQEAHNQDMLRLEKERQKAEKERLEEQRRAREATEKLLSIEIEREKRMGRW